MTFIRLHVARGLLALAVLFAFATLAPPARAQSGVLVASAATDAAGAEAVELTEMTVRVAVDRQLARTRVLQIFANRTERPIEATYVFAIPTTASIADFAVWDGDTRIPGVILERRKARKLYEEIAARAIDPGLLEQEDEEESTTAFTVRVAPVPAFGTKRLEIEYTELLPIDDLRSFYSFPLKPSQYGEQKIGHLRIDVEVKSGFPLTGIEGRGSQFALAVDRADANVLAAHFEGTGVTAGEDFAFAFGVAVPESRLDVVAYRAPERISPDELQDPRLAAQQPDGYFQAAAVFNADGRAPGATRADAKARSVLLMLDTSLSMNGEKLDRAFEAVEYFLGALGPNDRFNLLLFNDDVAVFGEEPVPATPDQVARALGFVRASYLSGGTDLESALARGLLSAAGLPPVDGERAIVLITDGNPTLTAVETRRIVERFAKANQAGPGARLDIFGIGADTRVGLLGELARTSRGVFAWARETDTIDVKLKAFFGKVGRTPIDDLALAVEGGDVYAVYPDQKTIGYDGSAVHFFGRYRRPGPATFRVRGAGERGPIELRAEAALPERDGEHAEVPRLWARARVDHLLARIELDGESEDAINEIISLSKRYKFITPYTSFLAAPRSLLRPRTIRPGDPVLRVRTDESITSVVAVFPFGLVKPMRFLEDEGVWETRFLAPRDMADGHYGCRLVMTDRLGRSFEEVKRFRIDSRPPTLEATAEPSVARAGEQVLILVRADADTRAISARLFGGVPVPVRWDAGRGANVGRLRIPAGLPPGVYAVSITGEDFARNAASTEVRLEVGAP